MKRGSRLADMPPEVQAGIRQDTRKHTQHILRPPAEAVTAFLRDPERQGAWQKLESAYRASVKQRFATQRDAFDELAALARGNDVFLGCSCPTAKNPLLRQCHTWLALDFMAAQYPDLDVRWPQE
jgi:hypothetical protein